VQRILPKFGGVVVPSFCRTSARPFDRLDFAGVYCMQFAGIFVTQASCRAFDRSDIFWIYEEFQYIVMWIKSVCCVEKGVRDNMLLPLIKKSFGDLPSSKLY
jgi:hypothetical protein